MCGAAGMNCRFVPSVRDKAENILGDFVHQLSGWPTQPRHDDSRKAVQLPGISGASGGTNMSW